MEFEELTNFDDLLDSNTPDSEEIEEGNETFQDPEEEEVEVNDEEEGEEGEEEEVELPDYSDNPVYSFLQSRGISDPSKIQVEDEDGTVEEIDFNSLSSEEQLEILNQVTDSGLSDDEINTINYLRRNRMSLNQVMQAYANQQIQAYIEANKDSLPQKTYTIDDYSDDELYIVDLKKRFPDFTDEELLSRLEAAKENEALYQKETTTIRNAYKAMEDQAEQDRIFQDQKEAEDLRNNLLNAASQFNEIQLDYTDDESDSLVVEDKDKQQMISYLLDQDAEGKSQLVRDLENPDTLIELAWLRTQGAEVLSNITQYWKGMLSEERAKNRKLTAQLEKLNGKNNSSIVIPRAPHQPKDKGEFVSAWDNSGLI